MIIPTVPWHYHLPSTSQLPCCVAFLCIVLIKSFTGQESEKMTNRICLSHLSRVYYRERQILDFFNSFQAADFLSAIPRQQLQIHCSINIARCLLVVIPCHIIQLSKMWAQTNVLAETEHFVEQALFQPLTLSLLQQLWLDNEIFTASPS